MDRQQLLAQLKDIYSPQAISMRPATIAWYILFIVCIVVLIYLCNKWLRSYVKKRRQQRVLNLLNEAIKLYKHNPALSLANISILLRRIALAQHNRLKVANLSNDQWLKFLDHPLQTTEFSQGIGQILLTAPYQKSVNVDIDQLALLIERWIKKVV